MLKENRSLERGLIVLETLAQHQSMSLADLHRATGLPKSTLRRLLATLARRRFVRRSLADQLYRATMTLPDISIDPISPAAAQVADLALPHMLELTHRIGWPTDLHLLEEHSMRIVESTRSISPFNLYRAPLDHKVGLFYSASGLLCLSLMPIARTRALFETDDMDPNFRASRFGITWDDLLGYLAHTRTVGYGRRFTKTVVHDKLQAIALPLYRHGTLWGAVPLLWPKAFMEADDFAAKYLSDLRVSVEAIQQDIDAFDATRVAHNPS
ncbi:helix-turn-helix domain-containing protein [Shimia abyssi]|uniref:IclR family transcriptional regulator n=1 Tax=Shimia abyssi TaxID=1662395 RepID=A0A2P8FJT9_9RHOB|nr:helix-turn-helix domain-containing protein [Shimia abyssi]PSL21986.1 IclR family transcriptional regulator [Shimia abyssi]